MRRSAFLRLGHACVIGCCIILAVLLAVPAHAVQVYIANPLTTLQATRVYLGASRDSQPIGLLENGRPLDVLARIGSFYRIDCRGQTGYIHTEQVEQGGRGEYYVNCSIKSSDTVYMQTRNPLDLEQLRQDVLATARAQVGDIYVFGGESPGGFDCSGLMEYIFHANGFEIPRTADPQLAESLIIDPEALAPGDLIFFDGTDGSGDFVTHVGVYLGDGDFIHAGFQGGVCIRSLDIDYFADRFVCARRLLIADGFPVSNRCRLMLN